MLGRAAPPERQVFINGKILTMDASNSIASAVAVERDRIVAVGDEAAIAAYRDGAQVIDLGGKVMMPGIIDAHGHFPGTGARAIMADLNSPPIGSIEEIADIQAALQPFVDQTAPGKWVSAMGYDDTLLAEKRHPTRQELDAVSTEHPIFITHVSGHMGVANSLALEVSAIDASTPNPEGGVIVKDPASGEPTGLLEETVAQEIQVGTAADTMTPGNLIAMFNTAVHDYVSQGVTTGQSGGAMGPMYQGLAWASKLGLVPFRLEVWPFWKLLGEDVLTGEFDLTPYETPYFRGQTMKIVSDGSIQGFTGYLADPYHTPFRGDADYRGYPIFPRAELVEIVGRVHATGMQMAIHANGDAAIDDVIHAFDLAQQANPVADPRLILIHSQMARDDQLDEMKRLGITPSFFSAHTYYWGDRHRDIFMGPERARRMSPSQSALERDLMFSTHLDSPVVPMEPMRMLWATVNRISTGGEVIGERQRIPAMEALRAITINAAYQIFRDDELGSIEPGKYADLVVLDGDPLTDPAAIADIQVLRTVVGGLTVFER
ncbi:amidohydrolase [Halioglobus japonicus]|uniref:Amidohydrolase n=2 Tax=Halioglobus japonicus TaxID=930805 RepID=A0AAP8MDR9_9GAMM|nr:amidohydrolase [Halioglobus japonicus]PLW85961.1 amidohydrolase [Halioglobus japonicus]